MSLIASAIIGGIIGIGTSIAGAVINKRMTDDANDRSERLYQQQRADEEKIRKANERLAKQQMRFARQKFNWEKAQTALSRGERAQGNILANAFAIANQNQATRNLFVNLFERRRAA